MTTLIQYLESFNRKERFFLVGAALGNPDFRLADNFRTKLGEAFGVHVPSNVFVAMDYHLDWLHTSLFLMHSGADEAAVHSNDGPIASGNQEDTDLLVAFEEGDITHLLLIEAKAYTGWTNKQMKSKACRLKRIFGADGTNYPQVKPHFCLMSPRPSKRLDVRCWPHWMTCKTKTDAQGEESRKPIWRELTVPGGRRRVTRWDAETGKASVTGESFRIVPG